MLSLFCTPVSGAKLLVDQLGRKVSIPDQPKRVIALAPSITEIIYAIDQGHRLVGVTRFSDYPSQAESLPKVGSYIQLDLERIVALQPDLCIAVKDGNPQDIAFRIESLQIPLYAVDPRNVEAVMETILEIGNLLNAQKKANTLSNCMKQRIQKITQLTKNVQKRPHVFFQIGISPIVSVGTNTFIHELIGLSGGINLTQGSVPYPRYSKEQVISMSPDVFIITSMARQAIFNNVKKEWQKWQSIPAVRNNRIHLVDSNLFDRASPRLVDGLELLLKLIHPSIWKKMLEHPQ